jgi:hypothetical protein
LVIAPEGKVMQVVAMAVEKRAVRVGVAMEEVGKGATVGGERVAGAMEQVGKGVVGKGVVVTVSDWKVVNKELVEKDEDLAA